MHPSAFLDGHVRPSAMDIDAMLYDVSNRMARAQLARQMSNGSSTYRQRVARVRKANSVGSSPQNVQRRRTTATAGHAARPPAYRSDPYPAGWRRSQQELCSPAGYEPTSSADPARPVSWHPSSRGLHRASARLSAGEMAPLPRPSMPVYRTVAAHGLPTPMTQPDLGQDLPVDPSFSLDCPSLAYPGPDPAGYDAGLAYPPPAPFVPDGLVPYTTMAMSDGYHAFSPMDHAATQSWTESLAAYPAYAPSPPPGFLPIQHPSDLWQSDDADRTGDLDLPELPRSNSKELVGMGLYDHPDRPSQSLNSLAGGLLGGCTADPHRESMGKGLKLEETWEPPEEDKSSDEDEDGEAEAEEEEEAEAAEEGTEDAPYSDDEDVSPGSQAVADQAQAAYPPPYMDLSNQSFFFDDTYGDGMEYEQPNVDMGTGMSNLHGGVLGDFGWRW